MRLVVDTVETFRDLVLKQRLSGNLSQDDVAGASGVTQALISKFESSKTDLTLSSFFSIAQALGFQVLLVKEASHGQRK